MLTEVLRHLDDWIQQENVERKLDGRLALPACELKVVGQTALIEAQLKLHLAVTQDVDVFTNADYAIRKQLEDLLRQHGKFLDPDSDLIWMPKETKYVPFFSGSLVRATLAQPEYILLSKALKAPEKNRMLVNEYLAQGASKLFLELAAQYQLKLDQFL